MTFSTGAQLSDIPAYDHARADDVFAQLESTIRDLLDAIIPSRVISIGLTRKTPTTWTGQFLDDRIVGDAADWYLSVNAPMPAFELVEQFRGCARSARRTTWSTSSIQRCRAYR